MSYCLPNWRLIYTLLLLVSILFAGCRSDVGIETQPVSKLSPDQLVTQTFHYTGSDQTIQSNNGVDKATARSQRYGGSPFSG